MAEDTEKSTQRLEDLLSDCISSTKLWTVQVNILKKENDNLIKELSNLARELKHVQDMERKLRDELDRKLRDELDSLK